MNSNDDSTLNRLIAAREDPVELGAILDEHRNRLRNMVTFRLDRKLAQRVDPSDVIQETFVDVVKRIDEFLDKRTMPFFLWLRLLTQQKIATLYRHHLQREGRSADREVPMEATMGDTSTAIAAQLASDRTDPGDAVAREELHRRLHESLAVMNSLDREVLALRHFEDLTNIEAAAVLGIEPAAASKRYVRALQKLREIMVSFENSP